MEHSGARSIFTVPSLVHKVQEAGIWVLLFLFFLSAIFMPRHSKNGGKGI